MLQQPLDDRRVDLDPSLESHFAALLVRHKEATAKTGWRYHEFLPLEAFRASARAALWRPDSTPHFSRPTSAGGLLANRVRFAWTASVLPIHCGFAPDRWASVGIGRTT